jgi:DNA-binding CsgD family transcriptional regulator
VKLSQGDVRGALALLESGLTPAREINSSRLIAWQLETVAHAYLLAGDLSRANAAYEEAIAIDHGIAAVRSWLAAIGARIGTLRGDDDMVRRSGIETLAGEALASGSDYTVSAAVGALLLWQQARGDVDESIVERAVARLEAVVGVPWDVHWFAEAASRFSLPLAARARAAVAGVAALPGTRAARASLALLDARLAVRERRREAVDADARHALDEFKAFGWPVEEAYARALRGGVKDAVAILRRIGAGAEATRLMAIDERIPRRRGETTLTAREREIASRIASGKTNREVAEALVISERTVETHVASIFGKLGVANRRDLAALLNP